MRMRTLWTIFGVTGGFFVSMNIVGLLAAASIPLMMVVPSSAGWWLVAAGLILSILLSIAIWIVFIRLSRHWGKASEARVIANPDRSRKTERSLLWLGIAVSLGYLAIIGFYSTAGYFSARGAIYEANHRAPSDTTKAP